MKFSKNNKIILGVGIFAALILWAVLRPKASSSSSGNIGVVQRKDLVQRITIAGPITSRRRLDVKPSFVGFVQKIYVKVGDVVKPGDPLVTFSPSLSQVEANFPVRAAFHGKVTQVLKTEGEYVTETGEQNLVMRVEDLSELFVTASVPEVDIAKVKIGQKTTIKVSSLTGDNFSGVIREISLSAKDRDRWSSSSTEFSVKVAIESKDERLLTGMSVLCDVITNRADKVLVLPHEYIQQDADGKHFVTLENGQRRDIKLGLQTDEGAEIKDGLEEGAKVRVIDFASLPTVQE